MKHFSFVATFFCLIVCVSLITSCAKEQLQSTIKSEIAITENQFQSRDINNAIDLFSALDVEQLNDLIENEDTIGMASLIANLADTINDYMIAKYEVNARDILGSGEEQLNDQEINIGLLYTGLSYGLFENIDLTLSEIENDPNWPESLDDPESCFYTALGTVLGLTEIDNIVKLFKAGEAASTILATVRLAVRRVTTIIVAVTTVYQLGDCLGWW